MWMFSVWFIIGREITQPVQIFGWNANPKLPFHKVRNAARESRTGQRTIRRPRNWFGHGGVGLTFGRDVVINLSCLLEFHRANQVQPLQGPNLISCSWAPSMHDQSWCLDRVPVRGRILRYEKLLYIDFKNLRVYHNFREIVREYFTAW